MTPLDAAVRDADLLRDHHRFAEAAGAYRAAVSMAPLRADLWVQLGNMLKDAGQHDTACMAYDEALRLAPDNSDAWLQCGRAQRLLGRRVDAFRSLTEVLRRVPTHVDAISELIQLGDGWQTGQRNQIGPRLLLDVLDMTKRMRDLADRVEAELPIIRALNEVPIAQYDIFRRTFAIPTPKPGPVFGISLVMRGNGPLEVMLRVLQALQEQVHPNFTVAMPDLDGEISVAFTRLVASRPDRFINLPPVSSAELAEVAMPAHPGLVFTTQPALLHPEALAWIAAGLRTDGVVGVLCDEDTVQFTDGPRRFSRPLLRGDIDPEMLEQGIDAGLLIAGRTPVVLASLRDCRAEPIGVAGLAKAFARHGRVPVIHLPLASRLTDAPTRMMTPSPIESENPIAVVILTRDRLDLLRPAIAAARETARVPDRLSFVVVDNGSTDPATLAYLAEEARMGRLQSLRVDEPFNWSRLNRLGASVVSHARFLVFMNNDVNLTTSAWDDRVAMLLERPEVGVVGAKLLYPNGTIQHAGIAMTPDGRTEHDGRGEAGDSPGPGLRHITRRSVTAVTGAFLATRRATFDSLGGFDDEGLPLWLNDVDFCLKASRAGLRIVYEPAIIATHFESKTLAPSITPMSRDALFEDAMRRMNERWGSALTTEHWSRLSVMYQAPSWL